MSTLVFKTIKSGKQGISQDSIDKAVSVAKAHLNSTANNGKTEETKKKLVFKTIKSGMTKETKAPIYTPSIDDRLALAKAKQSQSSGTGFVSDYKTVSPNPTTVVKNEKAEEYITSLKKQSLPDYMRQPFADINKRRVDAERNPASSLSLQERLTAPVEKSTSLTKEQLAEAQAARTIKYDKQNREKAEKGFENYESKSEFGQFMHLLGNSISNGVESFAMGIGKSNDLLFSNGMHSDLNNASRAEEQEAQFIRQRLEQEGDKAGIFVQDIVTNVSQNAIPQLISLGTGVGILGQAMFGLSTFGNTYGQTIKEGYNKNQALAYSLATTASEVGLSSLISGIPGLGGYLSGEAITKVTKGMSNTLAKVVISRAVAAGSEFVEESSQDVISVFLRNWLLDENNSVSLSTAGYSGLLGLASSLIMGIGGIGGDVSAAQADRDYKKAGTQYKAALEKIGVDINQVLTVAKTTEKSGNLYKVAKEISKNKEISEYDAGRLYYAARQYSEESRPIAEAAYGQAIKSKPDGVSSVLAAYDNVINAGGAFVGEIQSVADSADMIRESLANKTNMDDALLGKFALDTIMSAPRALILGTAQKSNLDNTDSEEYNNSRGEQNGNEEQLRDSSGREWGQDEDSESGAGGLQETAGGVLGDSEENGLRPVGRESLQDSRDNRRITDEQHQALQSSVIRDDSNMLKPVFHFTPNMGFETFGEGQMGFHFGSVEQANGRAVELGVSGRTIKAYLAIKNPIRISSDIMSWWPAQLSLRLYADGVLDYETYKRIEVLQNESGREYNSPAAETLRSTLADKGYDGIVYENLYEGKGESYIAFYPEQVVVLDNGIKQNEADFSESASSMPERATFTEPDTKEIARDITPEDSIAAMATGEVKTARQRQIEHIAGKLGIKIRWSDAVSKGTYNHVTKKITLNPHMELSQCYTEVFKHELVHWLERKQGYKRFKDELFESDVFADFCREKTGSDEPMASVAIQKGIEYFYNSYRNSAELSKPIRDKFTMQDAEKELIAEFVSQKLFRGDATAIDTLTKLAEQKPSLVERIGNWIRELIYKFKGDEHNKTLLNDFKYLEKRIGEVMHSATKLSSHFEGGKAQQYSISNDSEGEYVKVDVNQNIFEGKSTREMQDIARKVIKDSFKGQVLQVGENGKAYINKRSSDEYAYPANRRMNDDIKESKMRAAPELNNLLAISRFVEHQIDDGRHPQATKGWDVYLTRFEVGGTMFSGEVKIMNTDRGSIFYDITQIKRLPVNGGLTESVSAAASGNLFNDSANRINGLERPKPNEGYALTNAVSNDSILNSAENVNTDNSQHAINLPVHGKFDSKMYAKNLAEAYNSKASPLNVIGLLEKIKEDIEFRRFADAERLSKGLAKQILDNSDSDEYMSSDILAREIFFSIYHDKTKWTNYDTAVVQLQSKVLYTESKLKKERERKKDIRYEVMKDVINRFTREDIITFIRREVPKIVTKLQTNSDAKHVPEHLKGVTLAFLDVFKEKKVFNKDRISNFLVEYQELKALSDDYDFDIEEEIKELRKILDGKELRQLDFYTLTRIKNIVEHMRHMIVHEDEVFIDGQRLEQKEVAQAELGRLENESAKKVFAYGKNHPTMMDKMKTPIYLFEEIGGRMLELFNDLREAAGKAMRNLDSVKAEINSIQRQFGYKKSWKYEKSEFTTEGGKKLTLTRGQVMSLYATYKREQTLGNTSHLLSGGIVPNTPKDIKNLFKKNDEKTAAGIFSNLMNDMQTNAIAVTEADIKSITSWLTDEETAYIDALVKYITVEGSRLGNETAMALFGYKKYGESYYFPFNSSSYFLSRKSGLNRDGTKRTLKNSSFTKNIQENAQTPLVLEDFTETIADHMNMMSMYNALTVPLDNLTRVYNYVIPASYDEWGKKTGEYRSIRAEISRTHGVGAAEYIDRFIEDMNGGILVRSENTLISKLNSLYKKSAVAASLSVVFQQPTSIIRAFTMINAKYFNIAKRLPKNSWEECKQYCAVAMIKEKGGFDTGTGAGTVQWLVNVSPETKTEKVKEFFSFRDSSYRDDLFMRLASKADEVTWCYIWEAVKNETVKTTNLKVGSEEFFEYASKRFTDIIDHTQVYDSVMSRSQYMRSKNIFDQVLTSFMAEPTVTVNMIAADVNTFLNAKGEAKKEAGKRLGKTLGIIALQLIVNNLAKAIIMAMRDDDEKNSFLEKYISKFATGLVDDSLPHNYFPILKDVASLLEGYEVKRMDMELIDTLIDSIKSLDSDEKTAFDKTMTVLTAVSSLLGIPLKNIYRDGKAIVSMCLDGYNVTIGGEDISKTTLEGIRVAIGKEGGLLGAIAGGGTVSDLYADLAAAAADDNEKRFQKIYDQLREQGKTDSEILSGIKSAYKKDKDIIKATDKYMKQLQGNETLESLEPEDREKVSRNIASALASEKASKNTDRHYDKYDELYEAYRKNKARYNRLRQQLLDDGATESQINDGLELARIAYMKSVGIDINAYILAKLATSKKYADTDGSGGVSSKEKKAAIKNMDIDSRTKNALIKELS